MVYKTLRWCSRSQRDLTASSACSSRIASYLLPNHLPCKDVYDPTLQSAWHSLSPELHIGECFLLVDTQLKCHFGEISMSPVPRRLLSPHLLPPRIPCSCRTSRRWCSYSTGHALNSLHVLPPRPGYCISPTDTSFTKVPCLSWFLLYPLKIKMRLLCLHAQQYL